MGKVSYHFFTCLFNAILVYILLINFLGWSGGYVDVLGGTTTNDWNQTYFGFSSLRMMLDDLNNSFENSGSLSLTGLRDALSDLITTITFGLPKVAAWIQGGDWNPLDVFSVIFNIFAQPIMLVVNGFRVLGIIVWYVWLLVGVILKAFSGTYNVPLVNPLDWSSVQSEYLESVVHMVYVV